MDLKTNSGTNNRNNIDNEQGTLERLEAELKNTIFGVLFVLLKEYEVSIYSSFVIAVIQFMQAMAFGFHKTISSVWSALDITDVVYDILGFFNLVKYMKDTNWNVYITFFYIGIVIVGLVILGIIFISYTFSRKKVSFSWPVIALRNVLMLFTTVMFLPILDYFVSILGCVDNGRGSIVHAYFSEVECWVGAHILHTTFAIIGSIAFIILSFVASLTFFEYKSNSNDPTSRVSSRPNFLLNLYKMIMIICLTFLTGSQFEIVLLGIILVGSAILFMKFYFNSRYHHEVMAKLWSTLSAINLWTAVMLIFSRIMENTLFEGSVIAWIIGVPFVVLIILTNRDHRIDLLLINVNKFQSGSEVQNQIRYILKLMQWQATNRNAAILLDGYIEIHKQSCNKDDCPLRQKSVKTNRFTKTLMNQDDTLNEKYAVLLQLIYKMYFYGIKKFPGDTSLRISYAFFLLEKMHSKQQALQELTQAEQHKPHFDEQFVIYRYKKIIEDEIAESQNEGQGGLDVVSEVAFQNHLRQLQANIEKSALLHMEFWSQLSEDNPDLAKLNDIGSKINSSVQYVEDNWVKLMKINPNNAKSMRLYGKFLIEIINDKEAGDDLLEKARNITNVQSNKKAMNMMTSANDDYNNEATPSIWVSGEQDKFGIITGINLAAASLFGYNKTELLNRKVNVLMPQVYAKHHDSFLENYLNTGESGIIGKSKERLLFGKNKSNYIFPVYISLKAVQSIIQGIQFIATFRVEKNFKNAAYVLTTPEGTIDALSSSSINLLKIDLKAINQKKANIQDYIPNVIRDRSHMFANASNTGKSTAVLNFHYPKDSEYVTDNEESSAQLNCHMNELLFLGGRENGGFQFKFEKIYEKAPAGQHGDRGKAKISNFQFKYEKGKPVIVGEYVEGSTADLQLGPDDYNEEVLVDLNHSGADYDASGIDLSSRLPNSGKKPQDDEEDTEVKRVDYGVGIKTLRLFGGKPQEIDDDKSGDDDEENEESNNNAFGQKNAGPSQKQQQQQQLQQEEENLEEGSYKDFNTTFKSRKALKAVITDRTPPPTIRNLKIVANGLGLILLVIAIVDYAIAIQEFNHIQDNIDLLDQSNQRLAEMMNALSKIRDLSLLQMGLITTPSVTTLKAALKTSLDAAKSIKEQLEQATGSLSEAHLALLNQPVIELRSYDNTITKKGLTQATEEIISKAFELYSRPLADIEVTDPDYYFVTYNLFNNYYIGLRSSSNYYAQELIDRVSDQNSSFLLLLLGSAASLILAAIILLPIFYQVTKAREEVLSLFLDIPEKTVKGLYNKCETFISNLQVGEEDDMLSEIDEDELDKQQDENDLQEFVPRKKRKRFKNSGRSQRSFFLQFFLIAAVVEAYFLYNFISSSVLLDDINTIIIELNSTSVAEPFYSFANNAERQLFIDPTFPVLNSITETVVTNDIKAMYDLDSLILQEHSINRKIHADSYTEIFNQIMMVNPCPQLIGAVDQLVCEKFADLTVYQGMTVALTRHFENLRTLLSCYTRLKSNQDCTIDLPTGVDYPDRNDTMDKILSLVITTQANEIDNMQHIYIKESFRILMREFKDSLNDEFDSALTRRLIIFIIFIVVLAATYVVIWFPLISKVSNDIWRTKSMLSMIPLNVIAKIKSIRIYLKKFWNERNLAEY